MAGNLHEKVIGEKAEIELTADAHNESTGLSWLWAFLFGPIYFWVHGFVLIGFVILALNFLIIGFIIPPFIVYPLWKKRAHEKAEKLVAISKLTRSS